MKEITRSQPLAELESWYGPRDFVSLAEDLFGGLSEYGIVVPARFYSDSSDFFSAVEEINGDNLWNSTVSDAFSLNVEKLYASLARYFVDKWLEGGLCLSDVASGAQYVWGKRQGRPEDGIYLVDTDLFICQGREEIFRVVGWFVRHTRGMEKKCNKVFSEARTRLEKSSIPKVGVMKEFLANEPVLHIPEGLAVPEPRIISP